MKIINTLSFCRLFALIVLATGLSVTVFANGEPNVRVNRLDGSLGQIKEDSVVSVEDTSLIATTYTSENKISLSFDESSRFMIQGAFIASAKLHIEATMSNNSIVQYDTVLKINYNGTGSYVREHAFYTKGAYKIEARIVEIYTDAGWNVWNLLRLNAEISSTIQYSFSCSLNAIDNIDPESLFSNTDKDELLVSWPNKEGADEYDLEWTYIDSSALASGEYGLPASQQLIFRLNATRVSVSGTSYPIPLIYDSKGHLFFRVRSVQINASGKRMESDWSTAPTAMGQFDFDGHERKLNWQATTSYAEEGKRKTVVQYFDGSLRNRQTVTKDNSGDSTTIVAETFYDLQGRPVIQVLPSPTLENIIKYNHNFNTGVAGSEYTTDMYDVLGDNAPYCGYAADSMSTASGASRYYSPENPEKNSGIHRFIPDARKYPYTETQYTQDNTGRINKQGGVGPVHKIGSNHETVYYYGTPSQEELDGLFGTEVGHYSHYQKTMVKDANGQFSVSYMDMSGKTIATALAGVPTEAALDTLSSYTQETITETIADSSSAVIKDLVIESKKGLIVPRTGYHTFNYELSPQSIELESCDSSVCYDCLYDLRIMISGSCNNEAFGGQPFDTVIANFNINGIIDGVCNNSGFSLSFTKLLTEGSYEITKQLSVSRYGIDYYRDSIFYPANSCSSFEDFVNEQRTLLDSTLSCTAICDSCETTEYDDIRTAMLSDVSAPSGQYANIDSTSDQYSVFYNGSGGPKYKLVTNYVDEEGNPDLVYDDSTDTYVNPSKLSPQQFAERFKPSWATALLAYHPEYCKLLIYEASYKPAAEWAKRFEEVDTYAEAIAKGYLNPSNKTDVIPFTIFITWTGTHPDPDPLAGIAGFTDSVENKMATYHNSQSGAISIWQMASGMLTCGPGASGTCYSQSNPFNSSYCDGDNDMAWRNFKQMYLSLRKNLMDVSLANVSCSGSIPALTLLAAKHQPHFATAKTLLQYNGISIPVDESQANALKDAKHEDMEESFALACEAYIPQWKKELANCYDEGTLNAIIAKMVEVCKNGADESHPFGSSTIAPGSLYQYNSFQDILEDYSGSDVSCTADRITAPKPYNSQVIYSNKPVWTKPEDCECEKINSIYTQYQADSAQYSGFSDFMQKKFQTEFADSTFSVLRNLCAGNNGGCNYLRTPIILPPVLQCYSADVCINCITIDDAYTKFKLQYPTESQHLQGNDSVAQVNRLLFEKYFNNKFGFAKTAEEYLVFIDTCQISTQTVKSYYKDSLLNILKYYNTQININNSGVWASADTGPSTNDPNIILKNGLATFPQTQLNASHTWYNMLYISRGQAFCGGTTYDTEYRIKFPANADNGCCYYVFGATGGTPVFGIRDNKLYFEAFTDEFGNHYGSHHTNANTSLFTSFLVDSVLDRINGWNLVMVRNTLADYKVYYNGNLIITIPRNSSLPMTDIKYTGSVFMGTDLSLDWIRIKKDNKQVYFEDFTDPYNMSKPMASELCDSLPDCQATFVNFYNQNQGTNYTFRQIDSIYLKYTNISPNVCQGYSTFTDTLQDILINFTAAVNPNGVSFEAHNYNNFSTNDNHVIFKNGAAVYPQDYIPSGKDWYNSFVGLRNKSVCDGTTYEAEHRFKFPRNSQNGCCISLSGFSRSMTTFGFRPDGIYLEGFADDWDNYYGAHNIGADTTLFRIKLVDSSLDRINGWNTFKNVVTKSSYSLYLNGNFIIKIPRDSTIDIVDNKSTRINFIGTDFSLDWTKIRRDGQSVYFEDFNNPVEPSLPTIIGCDTLPDCEVVFANYFNQRFVSNYSFDQIDSIYFQNTGKSLQVCNVNNFQCENLENVLSRFSIDQNPNRVNAYLQSNHLTPAVYTDKNIISDGIMRWADSIRQKNDLVWVYHQIVRNTTPMFCMENGFSIETRVKHLRDVLTQNDDVIYTSNANVGYVIFKRNIAPAGLYLREIGGPDDNGIHTPVFTGLELLDSNQNAYLDWMTLKITVTPAHYRFYYNGVLKKEVPRTSTYPLVNSDAFTNSFYGYQGAMDWIKMYDVNGNLQYFEDFNDSTKRAQVNNSFLCPQTVASCDSSFVAYFNQQNSSNFNFNQIDSIYLSTCGKHLTICQEQGSSCTSLNKVVEDFKNIHDPKGINWVLHSTRDIMERGEGVKQGIFHLPEHYSIAPFTNSPLYDSSDAGSINVSAVFKLNDVNAHFCLDEGYSVEARVKMPRNAKGVLAYDVSLALYGINNTGIYGVFGTTENGDVTFGALQETNAYSQTGSVLVPGTTDGFDNWRIIRYRFTRNNYEVYFDNALVFSVARNSAIPLTQFYGGYVGFKGYDGSVDYFLIKDANGKVVYREDFDDSRSGPKPDPSIICPAITDCTTDFANYYNWVNSTTYSYAQIDSISVASCGKHLQVCPVGNQPVNSCELQQQTISDYLNGINKMVSSCNGELWHQQSSIHSDGSPVPGRPDNGYIKVNRLDSLLSNGVLFTRDVPNEPDSLRALANTIQICNLNNSFVYESRIKIPSYSFDYGGLRSFGLYLTTDKTGLSLFLSNLSGWGSYNVVTTTPYSPFDVGSISYQANLENWNVIKVVAKDNRFNVYINDSLILQTQSSNVSFNKLISMQSYWSHGNNGAIDYVRVYNGAGELVYHEEFDDCSAMSIPLPLNNCSNPALNCQESFTRFYNTRNNTDLTFEQINAINIASCGQPLNVCGLIIDSVGGPVLCGGSLPVAPPVDISTITNCSDSTFFIYSVATELNRVYTDSLKGSFDDKYRARCLDAYKMETFTVSHEVSEYHYTLYYYDQAGNLVKTIPPKGVVPNRNTTWLEDIKNKRALKEFDAPAHSLATDYRYNTLNQVVAQKTPDAGISEFWYDRLGRLAISQNAKQKAASETAVDRLYSYTTYDVFGRITEVGQVKDNLADIAVDDILTRNQDALYTWLSSRTEYKGQVTKTIYDQAYPGLSGYNERLIVQQRNLRNRVSYTQLIDSFLNSTAFNQATYYSYDIHGNVDTLLQDYGRTGTYANIMNENTNRFKKIVYNYDLISGKVNRVAYQPGWSDQVFHKYTYDAENRLTNVETSFDGKNWECDARYKYYRHGPLARMQLGHQKVQGIDYAYTLQGWLKGVNSTLLTPGSDMGEDGLIGGTREDVARDAIGFHLNYYDTSDYSAIGGSNIFPGTYAHLNPSEYWPLFNGNISSMAVHNSALSGAGNVGGPLMLYNYHYDQLNRLTRMDAYTTTNFSALTSIPQFKERVSYDGNGNILTYLRHGHKSSPNIVMDQLTYSYYANTNQLNRVDDAIEPDVYGGGAGDIADIDEQSVDNYHYDEIGNLIKDNAEGINSIKWSVYGKILEINKAARANNPVTKIVYTYDAQGNRISKTLFKNNGTKSYTWYTRDAQGNVMATYQSSGANSSSLENMALNLTERHIYGSSRLGVYSQVVDVSEGPTDMSTTNAYKYYRGLKQYELSNHLGNVLATITDKKKGFDGGDGTIDYYKADIVTAQDYYPFGMLMPGRIGYASSTGDWTGEPGGDNSGDAILADVAFHEPRENNLPQEYTATNSVEFTPGFISENGDAFLAYISPAEPVGGSGGSGEGSLNNGYYRYGFNGKENDNEVKGTGNQQDYGMRIYDPRLGRFLSVDPLTKDYAELTPYQFSSNKPIWAIDLDGLEAWETNDGTGETVFGPLSPENIAERGLSAKGQGTRSSVHLLTSGDRDLQWHEPWERKPRYITSGISETINSDGKQYDLTIENVTFEEAGIGDAKGASSLIPIYGSGRDAINSFQNQQYIKSVFNSAMAVTDIFLIKSAVTGMSKGGLKLTGSHGWRQTREYYLEHGYTQPGQPLHHWLIHQNGSFGKYVPTGVKNQMWNLKPFGNQASHMIYGHGQNYLGQRGANMLQQAWFGTPNWPKLFTVSYGGRGLNFALGNANQ